MHGTFTGIASSERTPGTCCGQDVLSRLLHGLPTLPDIRQGQLTGAANRSTVEFNRDTPAAILIRPVQVSITTMQNCSLDLSWKA